VFGRRRRARLTAEVLKRAAESLRQQSSGLDAGLLQLAFRQLDVQSSEYDVGDRRWAIFTGASLTLAVALVSTRASASTAVLGALPAFKDHWWPPLLGFTFAALLFAVDLFRGPRQLIGPDPDGVRPTLETAGQSHPEVSAMRMLTLLLVDTYEENARELRRHRRLPLSALGVAFLISTLIATGLCYWLVRPS
jgi:hypothetical protein